MSSIRLSENTNTFKDATLEITNKTIVNQDYVLQISTITQAKIGNLPKAKISGKLVALCLLAAIVCFYISSMSYGGNAFLVILGLASLGIIGYHAFKVSQKVQQYGLTIELNSGYQLFYISDDKNFLRNVLDLIDSRMQSPGIHQEKYTIHFAKGSIDKRQQNFEHSGTGSINVDSTVKNTEHEIGM